MRQFSKYLAIVLAAVAAVFLCLLLIPDRSTKSQSTRDPYATSPIILNTDPVSSSGTKDSGSASPLPSGPEAPDDWTSDPSSGISPATQEPSSQTAPETSAPPVSQGTPDYSSVTFNGDSRFSTLRSDGYPAYGLVPDSRVFALEGGRLTDEQSFFNAYYAGATGCSRAVFWYGINDVRMNPDRDNVSNFVSYYNDIITTFRSANQSAEIYILSILPLSPAAEGYYDQLDKNIRQYNERLAAYCSDWGYHYLDITSLYTGDNCLLEDHIHFTKAFYTDRLMPYLCETLGLYR